MQTLLELNNVSAGVEGELLLREISLSVNKGETHVLMGPNGAGKSTLGNVIMGNPVYRLEHGSIRFEGEEIGDESADKRAKRGIFLSFQNPLEVPGLALDSFIRNAIRQRTGEQIKFMQFNRELTQTMKLLHMDPSYAERDLNVGFSGGEKKKSEILQLLMLKPKFAILDETDSGLDVDAVKTVSEGVREFQKREEGALLIITHNAAILESLKVDKTHILVKGRLVKSGGPELVEEIAKNGFEAYLD